MLKHRLILAVLGCVGLLNQSAQAIPVSGGIAFAGSGSGTQNAGTTTFSFNNPMAVNVRTGDYLGIPSGSPVDFASFSWTGSGATAVLTSFLQLQWTFTVGGSTYQMFLTSLNSATVTTTAAAISGNGIIRINGTFSRDPTFARFDLQGPLNDLTFAIVPASGSGGPVPEGGSPIALLGLAAASLELLRRGGQSLRSVVKK